MTSPRVIAMEGVANLKITAEASKVRVQFDVERTDNVDLGALIRLAVSGRADVTIASKQAEIELLPAVEA